MNEKLYLFVTPDGITYSSAELNEPDVDNYQVLGFGKGRNEKEAFRNFVQNNEWLRGTYFEEAIAIEVKQRIYQGTSFSLKRAKKSRR